MARRLQVGWGLGFLPDGDALAAERETGRVHRIPEAGTSGSGKVVARLRGVDTEGTSEGGLLGLAVSPTYARDRWVYAYITTARDNRVVRFRLDGSAQRNVVSGLRRGGIHNGGGLAFGPDGRLYVGVGETGETGLSQDRASRNGKILRVDPSGSIPSDNPFAGSPVWSLGHRNVQGFDWDAKGRMWAVEFGQNTYDEVNLIRKGANYGWPVVEGVGNTAGGRYVNPKVTWPTSEASPSGAAIAGSTLYIGALQGRSLLRVRLDGTSARKGTPLLAGRYGRIRQVVASPDGRSIWFTTSNRDGRGQPAAEDDRVIRLRVR